VITLQFSVYKRVKVNGNKTYMKCDNLKVLYINQIKQLNGVV